jgi:hypothetical protein
MLRAVADKYAPLILEALARAAAQPEGTPLFSRKGVLGLFPNSAVGKPAAQKALSEHWLQGDADGTSYVATNAGLHHLIDTQSPKAVLNDFVRVLEDRESQVQHLVNETERLADGLHSLREVLGQMLPRVESTRLPSRGVMTTSDLADCLLTRLRDWSSLQDCPLPELYRSLSTLEPAPTLGQFHDALRLMHQNGTVYLHPWTGPLYMLPEPALALLVGHEVAYYASLKVAARRIVETRS